MAWLAQRLWFAIVGGVGAALLAVIGLHIVQDVPPCNGFEPRISICDAGHTD